MALVTGWGLGSNGTENPVKHLHLGFAMAVAPHGLLPRKLRRSSVLIDRLMCRSWMKGDILVPHRIAFLCLSPQKGQYYVFIIC